MMVMILLIQLKPKHKGAKRLGVKRPGANSELMKGQNVHKSFENDSRYVQSYY